MRIDKKKRVKQPTILSRSIQLSLIYNVVRLRHVKRFINTALAAWQMSAFFGEGAGAFYSRCNPQSQPPFLDSAYAGSWGGLAPLAFLRAQMSLSLLLGCNRSGSGRRQCRPAKAFGKFSRAASCPENSLRCAKPRALQPFLINRALPACPILGPPCESALLHCN